MRKIYICLSAALVATSSLSSCSRSNYAFQPAASAYHETFRRTEAAEEPIVVSAAVGSNNQLPTRSLSAQQKIAVSRPTQVLAKPYGFLAKKTAITALAKRIAAHQPNKHQEIARKKRGNSGAGTAGIVIGIGALILLIGGLIGGANIVATIGGIVFLVGLIMLIVALIKG